MLNSLRIQNFKSWQDTGDIQFGSITGFFGTNSSGKTSILQFLLMLKQTVESSDRAQILNLGDERSYVELGTLDDIIHNHTEVAKIFFSLQYKSPQAIHIPSEVIDFHSNYTGPLKLSATITRDINNQYLQSFAYNIGNKSVGMIANNNYKGQILYEPTSEGVNLRGDSMPLRHYGSLTPTKFYGFPSILAYSFYDFDFLNDLTNSFQLVLDKIYYLGPLRDYPKRLYTWAGERTEGVGNRGERAVAALLASRNQSSDIEDNKDYLNVEQHVAYWLKELGLIHSFEVRPIAPNRKEYEVRIKRTAESAEVFLTDVGFGVSQLLPVLVLLFYVPEGSTIILEQPEIHLHPAVQAGLADVFIDAIKRRNVQIILESHSEHLLQRLQRRLAEEALPTDQVKLYFTDFVGAASTLTPLDLDEYGNIRNWPKNFFGDSFADASAMMDAELKRREAAGEK